MKKIVIALALLTSVAVQPMNAAADNLSEAEIAAQIQEFEKGAAESAIRYKDERIPLSPCDLTVEQFMRTGHGMTIGQVESALGCFNIPTAAWQSSMGAHGNVQIDMNNLAISKPRQSP